ncbi:MAG: glycosyltransferase, partial [Chloroflexi bacterium]
QVLSNGIPAVDREKPRAAKPTFDVLFIGRVQSHKGPEILIRAFRRLADPTLRLHIAGAGPALEACRSLAKGDGRVALHGFVDGAARLGLLESADCVVLPSLWPENAPVTIQEAFQYGSAVVASRIGGIPEMVQDGVNGLLVEPGDESAIAGAIERLRRSPDLAASFRAAASQAVRLQDMSFHTAQLATAYRRLITIHRSGPLVSRAA